LAKPDPVELAALAVALVLGALLLGALLELELELLQAASRATAVIAAPGATHRFHLCVIALMPPSHGYCCHIPPITTCA
jgi:hypothetical protein